MTKRLPLIFLGLIASAVLLVACGDDDKSSEATTTGGDSGQAGQPPKVSGSTGEKPQIATPEGDPPEELVVKDIKKGKGKEAKSGDTVSVQYVGVSWSTGQEFDASWGRGEPFEFQLGGGQVIPGWDEGVEGMRVGGRRELVIPPDLAYGPQGQPPTIGPNETLVFVVDLEKVSK